MSVLYFRIFRIIKNHQIARASQRQQSCQISVRSRSYGSAATGSAVQPSKPSPLLVSSHSMQTDTTLLRYNSNGLSTTDNDNEDESKDAADSVKTKRNKIMSSITFRRPKLQRQARFNSLMVTAKPEKQQTKTVLYRQEGEDAIKEQSPQLQNWTCKQKFKLGNFSNHSSQSLSSASIASDQINIATASSTTTFTSANKGFVNNRKNMFSSMQKRPIGSMRSRLGQTSNSLSFDPSLGNTGHTKALVTTLLILGTYLLCYMPAVIFFAITCVDHCPFPITQMDWRLRISIAFVTNGLVVLKAIVDPMIYSYRMREMKSALSKFACLPFCKVSSNSNSMSANHQSMNLSHTPLRMAPSARPDKLVDNSLTKKDSLSKCIVGL